jgi:hypothetical protein
VSPVNAPRAPSVAWTGAPAASRGRRAAAAHHGEQLLQVEEGVLRPGDGPDQLVQLEVHPPPSAFAGQMPTLTGRLSGTATGTDGKKDKLDAQSVSGTIATAQTPPTAADAAGAVLPAVAPLAPAAQLACPILFLDLQPLELNLLGLRVRLSRVTLQIDAIQGAGNLLGNLLCAVVNLLNPGSGLPLGNAVLAGILASLIAALNDLLGGLLSAAGSGTGA